MNSSGNVGVKKDATSNYAMEVQGDVKISGDSWPSLIFDQYSRSSGVVHAAIHPASAWYGTLGTPDLFFGSSYVNYMQSLTCETETLRSNTHINGCNYIFSDRRIKSNIKKIDGPFDLLKKLDGKKYDILPPKIGLKSDSIKMDRIVKKDDYGFIAQDFMEVLPELVKYDSVTSLYAINYTGLIPIIVEAMKNQQTTINELTKRVEALEGDGNAIEKSATIETGSTTTNEVAESCMLEQNIPNPFSDNTRIDMYLPESISNVAMYIYNMQGKQIKVFKIQERGNSSVTISGYTLEAGMYLYTLIADGKEVDTKKMILTK